MSAFVMELFLFLLFGRSKRANASLLRPDIDLNWSGIKKLIDVYNFSSIIFEQFCYLSLNAGMKANEIAKVYNNEMIYMKSSITVL